MKIGLQIVLPFLLILSCDSSEEASGSNASELEKIVFETEKWKEKKLDNYPYRLLMYKEILYSDSVRELSKADVLKMLGDPDREENNHLYYRIERNQIGFWTLNQKSLVLKFRNDDSVEWIKLYE